MKEKIGFVGCGNMGCGILRALLDKKCVPASRIWVYEKDLGVSARLKKFFKVRQARSLKELAQNTEIILLAVKPQQVDEVTLTLKSCLTNEHTLVSILAGTTLASLKRRFGGRASLVRVMPNLGALVGEAMSALSSKDPSALKKVRGIFEACGEVITVRESFLDLVTAISGSGPAYFFLLMELLEREAIRGGLSISDARKLAVQTAVGSALLAKQSPEAPALLRERVTSKKGTTEAALKVFKKYGFDKMVSQAVKKAAQRAKELAK